MLITIMLIKSLPLAKALLPPGSLAYGGSYPPGVPMGGSYPRGVPRGFLGGPYPRGPTLWGGPSLWGVPTPAGRAPKGRILRAIAAA